jgi:hypothetical protein
MNPQPLTSVRCSGGSRDGQFLPACPWCEELPVLMPDRRHFEIYRIVPSPDGSRLALFDRTAARPWTPNSKPA